MSKLPAGVNIHNLIDNLRIFSWEAADILLYYSKILRNGNSQINLMKNNDDKDPVTIADLEVNKIILNRIKEKYPNIGWKYLSEENTKFGSTKCDVNSDWIWILDPLDGTKDFIQKTGEYAVHIALNYKNNPILGIVVLPSLDEIWFGVENLGTWKESQNTKLGSTKFQSFSKIKANTLVTSKNHINKKLSKIITELEFRKIKKIGSIGFKICSLLRKEADIYISISDKTAPKDWDVDEPEAVLKTAGGTITNLNNEELSYGKSNFEQGGIIIASNNNLIHQSICLEIKRIIKKYDVYP